ncbi:MAG: choice-of-anchor X domain-containing protein [bacterium]
MLKFIIKTIGTNPPIYLLLVLSLFWHCTEDNPIQSEQTFVPEISNLIAPAVVYNSSFRKHILSVKVEDPQGMDDIQEVHFEITKAGVTSPTAQGHLVDDGSLGDIIPNDGVFTTQIDGSFAQNDSGEFNLQVVAKDRSDHSSNILQASILVLAGEENIPPEIIRVEAPATVALDSSFNFLVTAEVVDAEGLADIQKVVYQFFPPAHPNPTKEDTLNDSGESGDVVAGDGIYSATLSSDLFKEASDYFLRLEAQDKSGNVSLAKVVTIRGIFLRPRAPVISNVVAPDTVKIHPTQVTEILVTVDVMDPQGLSDLAFVRFRSFLPDGKEASQSPFNLSDDGLNGDVVRGDGTYSLTIFLPSADAVPPVQRGDFRFVFQAKDKSGLLSNTIEHIMTVID